MKKLLLIAVLLFAFGTVSAQTGRDTISKSKQKDKSSMKAQDKTAKKDMKTNNGATRTNSTETRNPDGTLRTDPNTNDRNVPGGSTGMPATRDVPGTTTKTPTGEPITPVPGSGMTPK